MDTTGAAGYGAIMRSIGRGLAEASAVAAAQYANVWARFAKNLVTIIGDQAEGLEVGRMLANIFETLLGMGAIRQKAHVSVRSTTRSEQLQRLLAGLHIGYGTGGLTGDLGVDFGAVTRRGDIAEAGFEYDVESMQVGANGWEVIAGEIEDSALPDELKLSVAALVAAELVSLSGEEPGAGIIDMLPPAVGETYAAGDDG